MTGAISMKIAGATVRATGWKPTELTLRLPQADGAATPPVWRSVLVPLVMDYDPASQQPITPVGGELGQPDKMGGRAG